jgi:hypothetical protein
MNKKELNTRINYVKPLVFDLGSVTVVYGGVCSTGNTEGGAITACTNGPGANDCPSIGNDAVGSCTPTGDGYL